ncbi:hypothetical protein EJ05DRAFT_456661 [Pseudovirgaria hyperparasitica]|uniref:Uncharacterized protein n=1 Tax=Pseudovirgaria hyperparasitica TaxID=470096 RepID=A0A6A6VXD7_9PEZI|nr:uncharacterized protein EJ05DRAFT_456661 [Pseudovirgaria hyperparasitica]KAF2754499.1 hypothetical protein EJ05DRAFT_456661 [Pseudovirgaria hyperparasitica]
MFASLLRRGRKRRASEHSPYSSPYMSRVLDDRQDGEDASDNGGPAGDDYGVDDEDEEDEPLLPIFSSEHLDRLPTYNTTHSLRMLVMQKCETTISWDQLRSPQVSQFLVKPIQQQIRASFFTRATLYALISNCLQFEKEAQTNPGNMGVSQTRAVLCELLAVRLLKEYSTRELIDALFYDFDPLQGLQNPATGRVSSNTARLTRISTIEIAIRAQAKKFLAHPLIVQQLEAVWAGTIVFHSAADYLHRKPPKQRATGQRDYGTLANSNSNQTPSKPSTTATALMNQAVSSSNPEFVRRSVTLYDPHDASLFKLSRLRVPRYRQLFSTFSFAVMLGLFVAVLAQKSLDITALEVVFWFWSAGFMLDEVVGFTEQGFGLYIMSVWNAFDLGILLLFVVYYVLRLYGIIMPDARKHHVASMAYDVLGSTAVLLFPRLFSVLDHYRYFSQLLIAFRMMALDLAAVLILILISCSGFFVAFTLSFSDEIPNAGSAAYALFQMLMGFTPAAWDIWENYNPLGKAILTLFLIICHFLIVTILITVLTNSFMAIVRNANEEHQFLFAVNAISMVKSDALFSYVAPTNVLGWLLSPLRHAMPFRQYVKMNRTLIKITHFGILFFIFLYERLVLARRTEGPTDLVEQRGRQPHRIPAFSIRGNDLFSPHIREPSMATFRQDRALEEVFRRPFRGDTIKQSPAPQDLQRRSTHVVHDWMQRADNEGGASPPLEQPRSVLDRLETRRAKQRRTKTVDRLPMRFPRIQRSFTSDPEDLKAKPVEDPILEVDEPDVIMGKPLEGEEGEDGDDELITLDDDIDDQNDEASDKEIALGEKDHDGSGSEDYFRTPATSKHKSPKFPGSMESRTLSSSYRPGGHTRNISTNTILYVPSIAPASIQPKLPSHPRSISPNKRPPTARPSTRAGTGTRTPVRHGQMAEPVRSKPRPIMPERDNFQTTPTSATFIHLNARDRIPSMNARALDLASDIGDNRHVPDNLLGGMAASFGTQMEYAQRQKQEEGKMVDRIMLARMGQLEEGFREVVREVKEWRVRDSKTASKATSIRSSIGDTSANQSAVLTGLQLQRRKSKKEKGKAKMGSRKESTDTVVHPQEAAHDENKVPPSVTDQAMQNSPTDGSNYSMPGERSSV